MRGPPAARHADCSAPSAIVSWRASIRPIFCLHGSCWGIRLTLPSETNSPENRAGSLSIFDEGVDLVLYFKRLMTMVGHDEYAWHLNDFDALSPSQESMAKRRFTTFRAWWASWPGAKD